MSARLPLPTRRWSHGCSESEEDCASVRLAPTGNLTLWLRVLSGSAVLRVSEPTVSRTGLRVTSDERTLLLTGAVPGAAVASRDGDHDDDVAEALEPPATALILRHQCDDGATGAFEVHVHVGVRGAAPLLLAWRAVC